MEHPRRHTFAASLACLGFLLAVLVGTACSLSWSSKQSSNSVSSPFKSSSRSSSRDTEAFREEVHDFTYAYVKGGGDAAAFRRGVAAIAQKHGISSWEDDDLVLRSIGKGMGEAGLEKQEMRDLAGQVFENDPDKIAQVSKGYDSAK